MSNVNKAIYGPAALVVAQMIIGWLQTQGVPVSDQVANLVITPLIVGAVVWAVPNGVSLAETLHRIVQKRLGQLEKEIDTELQEGSEK